MLQAIYKELGIPDSYVSKASFTTEPSDLVSIGSDIFGRPQRLARKAAEQWKVMQGAASQDQVSLIPVSAYRSIDYQASLIKKKLESGLSIEEILRVNAAPGHSEHHTGRALDVTTEGCEPLNETFDKTNAFKWLVENAHDYSFSMSYPKDNKQGFIYEPWHWCYGNDL